MCAKSKAKNSKSPSVVEPLKTIPQKEMQQQQRFESDLLNLVVHHNLPLSFVDYPFFSRIFQAQPPERTQASWTLQIY